MKNYAFFPVSPKMVNERVARLNATFTVLIKWFFETFYTHFTKNRNRSVFSLYETLKNNKCSLKGMMKRAWQGLP